jgi:hypothetical protein
MHQSGIFMPNLQGHEAWPGFMNGIMDYRHYRMDGDLGEYLETGFMQVIILDLTDAEWLYSSLRRRCGQFSLTNHTIILFEFKQGGGDR